MSLLRFHNADRGPSGQLWTGISDGFNGTAQMAKYVVDEDDYFPYNAGNQTVSNSATLSQNTTVRFGALNATISAGSHAEAGWKRHLNVDLTDITDLCVEARIRQNADANSPVTFFGFSDQPAEDVLASSAIAVGSSENTLGLRWNADETIDLVTTIAGDTAVILIEEIATLERTVGFANIGVRFKQTSSGVYRTIPCVNSVVNQSKITNIAAASLPQVAMGPVAVSSVNTTTDPDFDTDWFCLADKV